MSESKGIVIEEQELREMARSARGCIQRIFLHWSGGHYGANEDAYHLCVDRDGQVYVNCRKLSEVKAHTWLRNSNAAAISLIEVMAKLTAILCEELGLVLDKDTVQTHCEIAFKDHYGPGSGDPYTKWDLWFLPDYIHGGELIPGGALLRGKALFYLHEMRQEHKTA